MMALNVLKARAFLLVLTSVAALALATSVASAQTTAVLRGRIIEASTQQPAAGARVQITGTTLGAVTNAAGEYTIVNVPSGPQRITVRRLGFAPLERPLTIVAGQTLTENFNLSTAAADLDAMVITGTAGEVSKRTVGNAITKLDVGEITSKSSVLDVAEVLQAKSPGVQILPNSGTPGTAADIRIRGAGSFIGNAPVFYVDGVRYSSASLGNFGASGAGLSSYSTQVTSALSTLSPDDIESIEIIKGPAASTLYGADAAGGVIQIITKKGRGMQGVQWSGHFERGTSKLALALPNNYTVCDSVKQSDAATWPGCAGVAPNTLLTQQDPLLTDPQGLRSGDLQRLSLSVRGGGTLFSYYVAGDADRESGVFYNSQSDRKSGRGNFTFSPGGKLDVQVNTSYIQSYLRLPLGDESAEGLLLSAVRGRPGRVIAQSGYSGINGAQGYAGVSGAQASAYDNETNSDRTTLSTTANFRPFTWFTNRLTVGLDVTNSLATILSPPYSIDAQYSGEIQGVSAQRVPRNRVYSLDYSGSLLKSLTHDLESTTSFGSQVVDTRYESIFASGAGLGAPDVTLIQTAQRITASNSFSANNSVGYYGQEQLGWKNRIFLTGALRADANSSFGSNSGSIIYPKASFSWVLSEEPIFGGITEAVHANSFKFRTAWGAAGHSPDPYAATQTYTVGAVTLGSTTGSAIRVSSPGNPNLRPERG
ncbi:MAG: TonB-dependent receptor plug domain-containing protein, partial [Gemmatimonadaceae bacterium]